MVNENLIVEIMNVRAYKGTSLPKIAKGISKSIYPLDYNKNNPMSGFNDWMAYISNPKSSLVQELLLHIKDLNTEIDNLENRYNCEKVLNKAYHLITN